MTTALNTIEELLNNKKIILNLFQEVNQLEKSLIGTEVAYRQKPCVITDVDTNAGVLTLYEIENISEKKLLTVPFEHIRGIGVSE